MSEYEGVTGGTQSKIGRVGDEVISSVPMRQVFYRRLVVTREEREGVSVGVRER